MKCPACGFGNEDGRGWCDFCKEPFRKKAAGGPPAAALTPELMRKLLDARQARPPEPSELPADFAGLDPGERIPETPPAARWLAWGFLGLCLFWALVGAFWAVSKFG